MNQLPRSMLFVSAEKSDRFAKAFATETDIVCIDLEDAVHPDRKAQARHAALAFAAQRQPQKAGGPALALRINGLHTRDGLNDVLALADAGVTLDYLLLPKVEHAQDLSLAHAWLSHAFTALVALVETPLGVENAHTLARAKRDGAPQLAALMLGGADLSLELGAEFGWDGLLSARGRLVNAARSAGLQAWDVPFLEVNEPQRLLAETQAVIRLGFGCKTAIHPQQIGAIHQAFAPSSGQQLWAQGVLDAYAAHAGDETRPGAFLYQGKLVDAPVLEKARRILQLTRPADAVASHSANTEPSTPQEI